MNLRIALLATAALTAACSLFDPLADERDELRQASTRWTGQGPASYQMVMVRLCFCGFVGEVRVTVEDGVRTSAIVVETGEPLDPRLEEVFFTIPELFEFLAEGLDSDPHEFRATYDATYGFPADVFIDYRQNVADEEMGYRITEFAPILD